MFPFDEAGLTEGAKEALVHVKAAGFFWKFNAMEDIFGRKAVFAVIRVHQDRWTIGHGSGPGEDWSTAIVLAFQEATGKLPGLALISEGEQ